MVSLISMRVLRKVLLPLTLIRMLLKWLPRLMGSRPVFWGEWPGLRSIRMIPRGWVTILRWRRWGPMLWNVRGLIGWERHRPLPWW